MERRAFERFPAKLQARIFFGNMVYTGVITNVSRNGMFISTKMGFPMDVVFMTVILLDNNSTVDIPVKVKRTVKINDCNGDVKCGLGVELLNPPQKYLEFISKYESSGK
jgi:DUF4097 and DUF4098 domain-containing protein YvlB